MLESVVLVVGLSSTSCEILKNLVLAGVGCHLWDDQEVTIRDTEVSLLFCDKDIGKKRSEVAIRELRSMNNLIRVLEDKSAVDITSEVGN